jgi:speckle-type POZ protein
MGCIIAVVDIGPHTAVNNSATPRGYNQKVYERGDYPVTGFTKLVKLYPNATICIDGQIQVQKAPRGGCNQFMAVLKLNFSDVEAELDLKDVKISLLFRTYKNGYWVPRSSCSFKEKSWLQTRQYYGVSFRHQYSENMSPEELGSHFQIQLVVKIPRRTSGTLVQDVQKLFSNRDFSDVTIVCGAEEEQFKCHKAILAVRSKVFCAMFNMVESSENQTGVVKVDDIEAKTMKSLLKYIYKNQVEPEDVDGDLLLAADKYDLQDLVSQCKNKVGYILSTENIFGILMASRMLDLNDINKLAMKWIRRHANDIQDGDQWNKLKIENPDLANEVEQNWILEAAKPQKKWIHKKDPFPTYWLQYGKKY